MTRQITFVESARDEQNVQRRRGDSVTVSDTFADYEVNAGRAVYVGQQTLDARLSINGTSLVDAAGNAAFGTTTVATSRSLTDADNGKTLECTATVTLTVPIGLMTNFGCAIIPNGTTSIASSGGALIQGATTTLTRAAATNAIFAIVPRASAANSYVVTGT